MKGIVSFTHEVEFAPHQTIARKVTGNLEIRDERTGATVTIERADIDNFVIATREVKE